MTLFKVYKPDRGYVGVFSSWDRAYGHAKKVGGRVAKWKDGRIVKVYFLS